MAAGSIERLLSLRGLNGVYERATHARNQTEFLREILKDLGVTYGACEMDLRRIPKKGPVIVVAHHPFGAIEGVILADLLTRVRPDVKIMANYLLGCIPEMRDLLIFVDPFGGEGAAKNNFGGVRQCLKHLHAGGLLAVFPAGEVSSLNLKKREVTDKAWTSMIGRMARRTGAAAVPVFFNGRNNALFQIAGLVHPKLRTALASGNRLPARDHLPGCG